MQLQALDQPGNLSTWAADINAAHADAMTHASSAIDYAKKAGALLLRAKQKLPHGAFGGWLEANCVVKARQAQYYMNAAQGKAVPVRKLANTQPAAYLMADEVIKKAASFNDMPKPTFIPLKNYAYSLVSDELNNDVVVIEPSAKNKGYFFVSRIDMTAGAYDFTRRPIRADFVEMWVKSIGIKSPADVEWNLSQCKGVNESLESLSA